MLRLKLQLYEGGVCSCLTHAHEAWKFTKKVTVKLQNWNARCLSKITGRTVEAEYKWPSFDLVTKLRVRRLIWLGEILRKDWSEPVKQVTVGMRKPYPKGHMLEDAPEHRAMSELIAMVRRDDGEEWKDYKEHKFNLAEAPVLVDVLGHKRIKRFTLAAS